MMNVDQVRCRLALACEDESGQYRWAIKHKLSPAYVSDVLRGKREPGKSILKALKLVKVIGYKEA